MYMMKDSPIGAFQVGESGDEFILGVDGFNNPSESYKISLTFENGETYEVKAHTHSRSRLMVMRKKRQ